MLCVLVPVEILDIWFGHVRLPRWFSSGNGGTKGTGGMDACEAYERKFAPASLPLLLIAVVVILWLALAAGWLTDRIFTRQDRFLEREDHELELHQEEVCHCFSRAGIVPQLCGITFPRALLVAMFGGFLFLLATGLLGPAGWDWKKITFAAGAGLALFVVLTVPDHFLKEHLWEHVLKKHLLRLAITVRLMSPVPP